MYNYGNNNPYGGGPYGNNRPFGRNNTFGSRYQYQTLAYGAERAQTSSLITKVMGLLAFSFIFASLGSFVGFFAINAIGIGTFWISAIGGLIVLIALNFLIQVRGLNLFLLYLFTFLEGMSLSPILSYYLATNANILGEAFVITAITAFGLSAYSWTTKRDFSRLGDYLFFGLLLLLLAGIFGIFLGGIFHTTLFSLVYAVVGVAIFSGYVLFYVQRAKYMADTLPNAIGLTVSLFITLLNLFLYILEILSIMQGGDRRR